MRYVVSYRDHLNRRITDVFKTRMEAHAFAICLPYAATITEEEDTSPTVLSPEDRGMMFLIPGAGECRWTGD